MWQMTVEIFIILGGVITGGVLLVVETAEILVILGVVITRIVKVEKYVAVISCTASQLLVTLSPLLFAKKWTKKIFCLSRLPNLPCMQIRGRFVEQCAV